MFLAIVCPLYGQTKRLTSGLTWAGVSVTLTPGYGIWIKIKRFLSYLFHEFHLNSSPVQQNEDFWIEKNQLSFASRPTTWKIKVRLFCVVLIVIVLSKNWKQNLNDFNTKFRHSIKVIDFYKLFPVSILQNPDQKGDLESCKNPNRGEILRAPFCFLHLSNDNVFIQNNKMIERDAS